jgi:subtilisin-like proprotein convertase family protein
MNVPFPSRNFFRKWLRSKPQPIVKKRSIRPIVEQLEDRTMLSVLPSALVSNQQSIATGANGGFSPDVAQDPVNTNNLIEVHVNSANNLLIGKYSIDGGQNWTPFINANSAALPNIDDPTTGPAFTAFTTVSNPTVTIDRAENVYITDLERNALNTSGALVMQRYFITFNGTPISAESNIVIQRWDGADPIENPVVAVDNNVPSFTDTTITPNVTQTDTMATLVTDGFGFNLSGVSKSLYVTWNTSNRSPSVPPANFNPNVIMVAGSSDGGANWTAPQIVTDGGSNIGNSTNPHYADPQMVFTQGTLGATDGGQLAFVSNDFNNKTFVLNSSTPDDGIATTLPAISYTQAGPTGNFLDAGSYVTSVASVAAGGSGYTPTSGTTGLTAVGGTIYPAAPAETFNPSGPPASQPGTTATFNATVNSSGGITTPVTVTKSGFYLVRPANAVATTGDGNGATLNLNWADIPATKTYSFTVSPTSTFTVKDLEVTLDFTDPRVQDLTVVLVTPDGVSITLINQNGVTGANLGEIAAGNTTLGTVFDDNAPRVINDPSFAAPYIGHFRPQVGTLDIPGVTTGVSSTSTHIAGLWKLKVTDNVNDNAASAPTESVDKWSLRFSHVSTTGFGADQATGVAPVPNPTPSPSDPVAGAAIEPYGQVNTGPFGPEGVGPGLSVAIDNTLGAFSPYQGRLYIAYTGVGGFGTDSNVYLMSVDNLTPSSRTINAPVQVNDDSVTDNFSQGNRPQFMPTVAVDDVTGTVGVMYYDGRWDPSVYTSHSRVANSFSDSIDGGQTFSTSTFFNTPKTAIDEITGKTITIEPVPGNVYQANATFGFGDRQGLVMNAGHVIPVFSSNPNASVDVNGNAVGNQIDTATVTIAAGPRIIKGDMGPIVAGATFLGNGYNDTFAPDGTQQFNGFEVIFDRPVLVSSFGFDQVKIVYHDTVTPAALPGFTIPSTDYNVFPVDNGGPFGKLPFSSAILMATRFFIGLNTPRSAVGTYSYAIGNITGSPTINDGIKASNTAGTMISAGNFMDENQNTFTGETPSGTSPGDVFAIPTPTDGPPFQLPYSQDTLPLIIPGPHLAGTNGTSVAFNPKANLSATDNLVLNGTNNGIDVTFDRNIDPTTFTPANILRISGPMGPITTYTLGPTVSFTGGGGSGASGFATIVGGQVTAVTLTSGGSGYTSPPTVVFNGGGGTLAVGTASIAGGAVTGVTITNGGQGYSSTTPQAIPDGGTLSVPITISDSLQVNDLSVGVNVTHAQLSDLNITLVAPDLTQVPLLLQGSSGANLTGTIFDANAPTSITAGSGPYTGIFRPIAPVVSAAVTAGGSGYAVGDILTVLGGTFTTVAQLMVTAVDANGAVTGITVAQGGAYSVLPNNSVSVTDVTTPTATGATFALTAGGLNILNGKNYLGTWHLQVTDNVVNGITGTLNGWSLNPVLVTANPQGLGTADIVSGGSGYQVNDILTVQGGGVVSPGLLQVTSVDATGVIQTVVVFQPGLYSSPPSNPASVTGGAGAGATFNLGFNPDGLVNSTFRITFPTQTLSGTYNVQIGQDSVGNFIKDTSLSSATAVAGGSGYNVGDLLTVVGGTGAAAQLQVTTVSGGAITGVELVDPGSYTANPTSPAGVTDVTTPSANGATVNLAFGNRVDSDLEAGVPLLFGAPVTSGALVTTPYQSGTVNVPLPASQTVDIPINVPDSYLVQGVTVQLTIQHQNDPDLVGTLIAPDGTRDLLFSGVGTSGSAPHANFTGTTFDDSATTPIQLAATVPVTGIGAGPFNPQHPLTTAFQGLGSLGTWNLEIQSNSSTLNGTLVSWQLNLKNSVAGQGQLVADEASASFRIFTQDPTNPVSQQSWTAVGPASISNGDHSGRIGGLAIDPSDPSGNTVYTAGASGGVWKTTDFMTTDPNGPTWQLLTGVGPAGSLNTGSIAVFGRNNDPNQSIIFVATGEGDTGTGGVGFLRSMDGGRTWRLLDSSTNVDSNGNVLPINDPGRDHKFVGVTSFKVIVDPTAQGNGQVLVYAAMGNGVWRSADTGGHWTQLQAGKASDVVLSAGSADATGNLQVLYGAIEGQGVYITRSAPTAFGMILLGGNQGNGIRRDVDVTPTTPPAITINNDNVNPSQAGSGRIDLGVPALTGNPLKDTLYEGWIYAVVNTGGGAFGGLYVSKDFGQNWTKVRLPVTGVVSNPISTNNDSIATDYSVDGNAQFPQANYDVSFAVDPNNPSIVYIGGTADANPVLNGQYGGFIRVDTSTIADPYATVAYDNSNNDAATIQFNTQGALNIKAAGGPTSVGTGLPLGPGEPYGLIRNPNTSSPGKTPYTTGPYLNMLRDPNNPFLTPASLQYTNIASFGNSGEDARYGSFTGGGLGGTDQHRLVVFKDPLTGHTRLIFGDDQGVWTGTDNGTGNPTGDVGSAVSVVGSRNGNLQITQFYDGAAQPSTLAADIAGALFYGMAQDDGFPKSDAHVLDNGNIGWTGPEGDGTGVKTDQTGTGQVYYYKWPCCGGSQPLPTDFFTVAVQPGGGEVSRTTGLIKPGDNPGFPQSGQWPYLGGSKFAVNPIDPTAIVMSNLGTGGSTAGNVYLTSGSSLGTGKQWFEIAARTDLDGTYAPALAFGAPANASASLSNFIYVGTNGGHIYVTFTGGGVGLGAPTWNNISAGLDTSAVQFIVANPNRGSHEAYAVTQNGVYWMADSSAAGATWVNVTGNIFQQTHSLFNDPAQVLDPTAAGQKLQTLGTLTALQADYRYAIPDSSGGIDIAASPNGATELVNTVTITTSVAHGFSVGQTVQISGVGVAGYNGTYTITSVPSATSFTYTSPNLNMVASGGGTATPTHPVLYVGGVGGVFRSFDKGTTWTFFPDQAIDGAQQEGGLFPAASSLGVTDLALSLGNINPLNGQPSQPFGRNMLVATTYGAGTYAIRLNDQVVVPNGNPLYTYAVNPVAGPHVVSVSGVGGLGMNGIQVTFSGPVDPATFTADKVNSVTDPFGNPVPVASIADLGAVNHNVYEIVLANPESVYGFYHISLGPNISDYSGNKMDQNENSVNGENPGDIYTARFLFQPFVNHAPVITGTTANFGSVNEDQPAPTIVDTVNHFVTTMAPAFITDPDNTSNPGYDTGTPPTTAPVGIAVTGVDDSNGLWQYSLDNGTTWLDFGSPSDTNARLLEANSNGIASPDQIRFVPQGNFINSTATFTFRAWDLTSGLSLTGADGGTADASINGGSTAYSATSATAIIAVNFVNDQPSFTAANPPAVNEDSGAHTVTGWVTNFNPGGAPDPNELSQSVLAYHVTNITNASLFAAGGLLSVDTSGNLTYTLKPSVSGTTKFTVTVQDNGGTANGGIDTSVAQTFTLTVNLVNDQPSFTASNQTANANTGAHTVTGWATFNPGGAPDANEASQSVLAYTVSNVSNPGLFAVLPAVNNSGTLTYTLNPNVSGQTTFDVKVRDSGGTANGGIDTSATQTFTLTLGQAPKFTTAAGATFVVGSPVSTFNVKATGSPAPTITESGDTLPSGITFNPGTSTGQLTTAQLTGTPNVGMGKIYTLTFTALNSIGKAVQTFLLTVKEAPQITSNPSTTFLAGTAGSFTATATGFPKPTFTHTGGLPTGVTLSAAGLLSGTPTGPGTFTVTLIASNGTLPNATQTFTLTVVPALTLTAIPSKSYLHNVGTISLNGASNKNSDPTSPTYTLVITSQSPKFTGNSNIDGSGQITITNFSQYVGKVTFKETVNWNGFQKSQSFTITFTNVVPTLAAIANQTMTQGATNFPVPLTFSDTDGDPLTFTFSASAYSPLFALEQKLHLTYVPKYDNLYIPGLKWLHSDPLHGGTGQWFALRLVNGNSNLYASGFLAPTVPLGALVASFSGSSVYNDPTQFQTATPPPQLPAGTVKFSFNQPPPNSTSGTLLMTLSSSFTGQFQVTVTVSDGLASVSRTFIVTVN